MSNTPQAPDGTDYARMDGPTLLKTAGDNAWNWAHAFQQKVVRRGQPIDAETMIGWFANAIEHSYDVRTGSGPTVLPDGSAFFVGTVGAPPEAAGDPL